MEKYGIIKNVLSKKKLDNWKKIYQKVTSTKTNEGDPFWGIDNNCLAYNWFLKEVMPTIQENSPQQVKLIFSAFVQLKNPINIHKDLKDIPNGVIGQHYRSILFPYAVDNDKNNFKKASTRFYNNSEVLSDTIIWEPNSIIWWNSEILHDSGDFHKLNIGFKEYFITHTYV